MDSSGDRTTGVSDLSESLIVEGHQLILRANFAGAVDSFRKLVESAPEDKCYITLLGCTLERVGETVEAAKLYRKAIGISPDAQIAALNLGYLLLAKGNVAGAMSCLQRESSEVPCLPGLHILPSFQVEALPKPSGTNRDFRESAACLILGQKLQENGRLDQARSCFERAIALSNFNGSAYYALAQSLKFGDQTGAQLEQMLGLVRRADLSEADRSQIHFAIGKAYDDLANYELAIHHFDKANEMVASLAKVPFDGASLVATVDAMIQTYTKARVRDLSHLGSASELPILIVGMMRSGTTLVEQILSSHLDIADGGELVYWRDQGSRYLQPGSGIPSVGEGQRLMDGYLSLLAEIGPGRTRVTDKMPQNFMALGLIHTLFPNARIFACQRHPVDTALSIYMTSFRHPIGFANRREDIVFFYRQYQRVMDHWRSVIPENRLRDVQYEELLADRERVTRELIEFVGLEWDSDCLYPEANRRSVRTASVWQVRQPVYTTSSERWRRYEPWLGEFAKLL